MTGKWIALLILSPLLSFSQQPEMVIQTGHRAEVQVVTFAREHPLAASAAKDNTVILWQWQTGKKLRQLNGHTSAPGLLRFIFHDQVLVTAGEQLIIYDLLNGATLFSSRAEYFDLDEQQGRVLYAANDSLKIFEIRTKKSIFIAFDNKNGFLAARFQTHDVIAVASAAGPLALYHLAEDRVPRIYFNKRLFAMPPGSIDRLNDSLLIVSNWTQSNTGQGSVSRIINTTTPGTSPAEEIPGYYSSQWSSPDHFMTKNEDSSFIWRRDTLQKVREIHAVGAWFLKGDSMLVNTAPSWAVTDTKGKHTKDFTFPAFNRTYLDMIKNGRSFLYWFYHQEKGYIDTTMIFDETSPSSRQYFPGRFVGSDDEQQLVALVSKTKKNDGAFSVYSYGRHPGLVRNFDPPAFNYPVGIRRSGDTLIIRTNEEDIIQYNYSEKLGRVTATINNYISKFEKEEKSPWLRCSFERETDLRTDSVVFYFHNKFNGLITLHPIVYDKASYFLNNDDTLICFNAGNFKTSRFVVPQLATIDYFDAANNILGLSTYDNHTIFYRPDDPAHPIWTTERLPFDTYVYSGANFIAPRLEDSLEVYDLQTRAVHKMAGRPIDLIAGYCQFFDNASSRTSLVNILNRNSIVLPAGARAFPVLQADGSTVQHPGLILVRDNDTHYSVMEATGKQKIRFRYKDPGYQGIAKAYLSMDEKSLFTIDYNYVIRQWDFASGKLIQTFSGHSSNITALLWLPGPQRLYSCSADGAIKYWGVDGNCIVSHYLTQKEWLTMTSDGYYTCSRGAERLFAMTSGFESYAPYQLDAQLNRPDIVMNRLGMADSLLTKLLYQAYQRRSSATSLSSTAAGKTISLPGVQLLHPDKIPDTTTKGQLDLEIAASDSLAPIARVEVTINGQPVYRSDAVSSSSLQTKDTLLKIPVRLSSGANNIAIHAENRNGIKSYEINRQVWFEPATPVKPNLYFIALCIEQYPTRGLDKLVFAVKDGDDLAKVFRAEKEKGYFNECTVRSYYNEEARRKNLDACRDLLLQTKIDDEVVLFFSGHGRLGKDGTFYFVSYDQDPMATDTSGISLQHIEALLEGIPARKKILLIDACNSGYNNPQVELTKGLSGGLGSLNKAALINLLQSSFVAFNNTTGNVIIAASADTAQQNSTYQNGVFTYVIRMAAKDKKADLNGDGVITVNELNRYLSVNVYPLSFGNQSPVIMKELPDTDLPLFHLDKPPTSSQIISRSDNPH